MRTRFTKGVVWVLGVTATVTGCQTTLGDLGERESGNLPTLGSPGEPPRATSVSPASGGSGGTSSEAPEVTAPVEGVAGSQAETGGTSSDPATPTAADPTDNDAGVQLPPDEPPTTDPDVPAPTNNPDDPQMEDPPPTCEDETQNQDETGPDCGGNTCDPCVLGQGCNVDEDCQSLLCRTQQCVSCSDETMNGNETDIDCGGSDCQPCEGGEGCTVDGDCVTDDCVAGVCASCSDGDQNGDETDIDCGGTLCPPCGLGDGCRVAADCAGTASCVGGQCATCGNGLIDPGEECDLPGSPQVCTAACQLVACLADTPVCPCESSAASGVLHTYRFCSTFSAWADADAECRAAGMHLVEPENQPELDFVRETATANGLDFLWTGGNDQAVEGTYVWSDGDPILVELWSAGEPNGLTVENCIGVVSSLPAWNDSPCGQPQRYVCESL